MNKVDITLKAIDHYRDMCKNNSESLSTQRDELKKLDGMLNSLSDSELDRVQFDVNYNLKNIKPMFGLDINEMIYERCQREYDALSKVSDCIEQIKCNQKTF